MNNAIELSDIIKVKTAFDVKKDLIARIKERRKDQHLTQLELSMRAGVSYGSLKRFERTGEISFSSLLRIASVLDCLEDFDALFAKRKYASIAEVINEQNRH